MSEPSRLALPEELAGAWEHVVILTYGADLAFFEQDLWRKLGRVRNRIVLADDRHLAAAYADAAADSRLRHVNANYLASPVRNAAAAHAKVILLASANAGRLFVGSGNLGMHGYASQGEAFCRYDYTPEDRSQLAAFHAARELLEGMAERGYLDEIAIEHLGHLWQSTTWLYQPADPGWRPVRHNLDEPLLAQFTSIVGTEPVEELTVHAPFWDPGCQALRLLLERLRPAFVRVLLQEGETAVDGARLEAVLSAAGIPWEVRTVEAEEPGTYLHAKFVLVRQSKRAVCLQGSANVSLAALPTADPEANIEAANLLEGAVDAFDGFVNALALSEPVAPTAVPLRKPSTEDTDAVDEPKLTILWAEWSRPRLRIRLDRELADSAELAVLAGGEPVEASEVHIDGVTVLAVFDGQHAEGLDRMVAVALQVTEAEVALTTEAVYPYRRAALRSLLQHRGDEEVLAKAGSLDLEDEELVRLLEALNDMLVIDGESVWRIAAKPERYAATDDVDGPKQRYEDIDWDVLRRHPKVAQYTAGRATYEVGGLQLLLSSITDHFRGIGSVPPSSSPVPQVEDDPDFGNEDLQGLLGDDIDVEDADQPPELEEEPRGPAPKHHQNALKRFIRRYLKGLEDDAFIDLVGVTVMAENFTIFNAILTRLPATPLFEDDRFCLASQLRLWERWFGSHEAQGVLEGLDDDELMFVAERFAESAVDVALLRAVRRALALCVDHRWNDEHIRLRDIWRRMLTSPVLAFTSEVLAQAVPKDAGGFPVAGAASRLIDDLKALAWKLTDGDVIRAIASVLGVPVESVRFERARVRRGGRETTEVDVVVADVEDNPLTAVSAPEALAAWVSLDPDRDYYRVNHRSTKAVAVYDRRGGEAWWYAEDFDEIIDFLVPERAEPPWQLALRHVMDAAAGADRLLQRTA